jgi:hypothetical protein
VSIVLVLCSSSSFFDTQHRYEILLIAHRKPEWDWSRDMERAVCTISPTTGALVPAAPQPQPPDPAILFSFQWIDQVFLPMNSRGGGGSSRYERDYRGGPPSRGGHHSMPPAAPPPPPPVVNDYYTGDKPGFVVGCLTPMMNECFSRNLFGLPANRRVRLRLFALTCSPLTSVPLPLSSFEE